MTVEETPPKQEITDQRARDHWLMPQNILHDFQRKKKKDWTYSPNILRVGVAPVPNVLDRSYKE